MVKGVGVSHSSLNVWAGTGGSRRWWAGVSAVAVAVSLGVVGYLLSPGADVAPNPGPRQLDMLYLDEPAPSLGQLGVQADTAAVVVFCPQICPVPQVDGAQVVRSTEPALAAQYALVTSDGRIGPGYALIDTSGRLRYRTFDPAPADHAAEIQVLIDALDTAA